MATRYTPYVPKRRRSDYKNNKLKVILWTITILVIVLVLALILYSAYKAHIIRRPSYDTRGSVSIVDGNPDSIPDYAGQDYVILNDGKPSFNSWDIENITGEYYSDLDFYGRCGVAYAMIDRNMMPTGERQGIGQIKPTGWVQAKYEGVVDSDPPYLYNRCHLIAYALTGQNANEKNLITGTRYMNVSVMLPWEEQVMQYLDNSDNHVLYRVTPYFKWNDLVARGVEIEAYSVEDDGEGLCFNVFVYNVQPGVEIDYSSGESKLE